MRNRTLTCTTTASSCAVHAHAPRHFRVSPSPTGIRCKASPVVRTIATDFFIRCFFVRNRTLTCMTTASSCAVHAHAPRHFRASPFPAGVRCKASPVVRTTDGRLAFSAKNMRLFHGLMFFRYFGSLPPPADNRIVRNCDAHVPRYIHISAFPNGVRYSVLASLVLTSPVKSDMLILVCTTTASSCAVHAHVPRHFRASPSPAGVRCKASPVVRTTDGRLAFSAKNMRLFHGLIFFRYIGSLPPSANNRIVRNCGHLTKKGMLYRSKIQSDAFAKKHNLL